jgi:ABC-type antimicrobial peptide transport system permease subunit
MFIMLTVSERQVEYATLRASGYDRSSILRIVLAETLTQVGIAVILSIPMAVALTVLLNYRLSQSFFKVQFFWQWIDLVQAPAIAVAIATGVAVLSARSVTKKEIAPQLRSREIG